MKSISPINEEAVRKARDEANAGVAVKPVDVSKIYQTAPPPRAPASTSPTAGIAPRGPGQPGAPHAEQPRDPNAKVASRESNLKLYALVLIFLGATDAAYSAYGLWNLAHTLRIPGFATGLLFLSGDNFIYLTSAILPVVAAVALLLIKGVVMARAILIVVGLNFLARVGLLLQSFFYLISNGGSFSLSGFISLSVSIGILIWTLNVYRDVSLLEE